MLIFTKFKFFVFVLFILGTIHLYADEGVERTLSSFSPYHRHKMKTPHFKKENQKYLFKAHNNYENKIHIFQNPMESFAAKIDAIISAKESIHIQYLDIRGDETNALFAEILKIKAREGISVKIIVDAVHMYFKCKPSTPCFDLMRDLTENESIQTYGVELSNFKQIAAELNYKPFSLNKRLHEKSIIIDGYTDHGFVISGGSNIANKFAQAHTDPKLKWWDQDVLIKGPIVKQIQKSYIWNLAYYASQKNDWWKGLSPTQKSKKNKWHLKWNKKWGTIRGSQKIDLSHEIDELLAKEDSFGSIIKNQNKEHIKIAKNILSERRSLNDLEFFEAPMRYFQHRPKAGEKIIHDLYLTMVNEAKEEIIIANSYMTLSDSMKRAIRDALRRGVKIHLISNSEKSTDSKQTVMYFSLQQYDLLKLNNDPIVMKNGGEIKISIWKGEEIGLGTMHTKMAIFDKRDAFIGSFNFDYRSKLFNTENGILFHGEAALKAYQIMMEEYLPRVSPVTIETAKSYLYDAGFKTELERTFWRPLKYFF